MVSIRRHGELIAIHLWRGKQSARGIAQLLEGNLHWGIVLVRLGILRLFEYRYPQSTPSPLYRRRGRDTSDCAPPRGYGRRLSNKHHRLWTQGGGSWYGKQQWCQDIRRPGMTFCCTFSPPRSLLSRGTICYRTLFKNSP